MLRLQPRSEEAFPYFLDFRSSILPLFEVQETSRAQHSSFQNVWVPHALDLAPERQKFIGLIEGAHRVAYVPSARSDEMPRREHVWVSRAFYFDV